MRTKKTHGSARGALAGAAALLLLLAGAVQAQAGVTEVSGDLEVVFTNPTKSGVPDTAVVDRIAELIDDSVSGSVIHASIYSNFEEPTVATALESAGARGVDVQLLAEICGGGGCTTPTIPPMLASLATKPGVTLTTCTSGCYDGTGNASINHNKFFLFSELSDGRGSVVAQGSANMTPHQRTVHNNFVMSYDDVSFYEGFLGYWEAMRDGTAGPTNPAVTTPVVSDSGKLIAYFSPRPDGGTYATDPIASFIRQVDCSAPGGSIKMTSATWWSSRPHVREALLSQRAAGCNVTLIMDDGDTAASSLRENQEVFALAGIPVYGTAPGGCRDVDDVSHVVANRCTNTYGGTHEKYVVIRGTAAGAPMVRVLTGSHNTTWEAAFKGNDAMVSIDDAAIVAAFEADFDRQRDSMTKIDRDRYPHATWTTVNASSYGSQDAPHIARNAAGYTAVVWVDDGNPTPVPGDRYGAVYLALYKDGLKIAELPVQSGGTAAFDYREPSVGLDAAGNAVVVWQDDADGNGSYNIAFRRVSNTGALLGSRTIAHANTNYEQTTPGIGVNASGSFVISWTDNSSGSYRVRLAGFTATGAKSYETYASGPTGFSENSSGAGIDAAGNAYVVWRDSSVPGLSGEIKLRSFTPSGTARWATVAVNSASAGDQTTPAIAVNASGQTVVAWRDSRTPIGSTEARRAYVRAFTSSGTPVFTDFAVSPAAYSTGVIRTGNQYHQAVAIATDGSFVVAWDERTPYHSGSNVYAKSFAADGSHDPAIHLREYRMNVLTAHDQDFPSVAVDPVTKEMALVYEDDHDGNGSTQLYMREGFPIG